MPVDDIEGAPVGSGAPAGRLTAAVLAADVVGYVRLMELDEEGTHARLMNLRDTILGPEIRKREGRIVKHTGDGFMAMFSSAGGALEAAKAMQGAVMALEAAISPERRIAYRMGLNVSEVIVEPEDIYGDGVNVAARLQTHAEPGGIVISGNVAEAAGSLDGLHSVDLGQMYLRNHKNPVRVLSLRLPGVTVATHGDALPGTEARPSIAVLPFRKLATGDDTYFADGFVDNIIHALSALKELFVIARGSTLGFGSGPIDIKAVGRDLGVRYVLYGSVQRAGQRLRVMTELCDAETGEVMRPDQYDGSIDELFDFQDRIAIEVVKAIAPQVRDRELKRALRKHPQNMTAYDLVLQALEPLYRLDYASFARARGLLQRAMTVDPSYAPAFAYAAWWHSARIGQSWSNDMAMDGREALRLAEAALVCDPSDTLALAVYGHEKAYVQKMYDTALESFDRALKACPNSASTWTLKGLTLCFIGDGPSALNCALRGLELSPRDQNINFAEHIIAQAHYINGDFRSAVEWSKRAVDHNDRQASNLRTLISSLIAIGQTDAARDVALHHRQIAPDFSVSEWAARSPMNAGFIMSRVRRLRDAGMRD